MLNSPQGFRLKLDSSAYFPVIFWKCVWSSLQYFLLIFMINKTLSPVINDNANFASDCIFDQLLDDTYFFLIENQYGITLAFT
jgi:hypothetical protein